MSLRKDNAENRSESTGAGGGPRILAVRLTALGDVANTFPAVRGLRLAAPNAEISWVVEEAAAGIVRINRDVDRVFVLPRRRWEKMLAQPTDAPLLPFDTGGFIGRIRRERFDIMLDFQATLKSGLLGALSGVRERIGFAPPDGRELNHLFMTRRASPPRRPTLRPEKALALVRMIAPEAENALPNLEPPASDREFIDGFIGSLPGGAKPLVGIHPGTSDFGSFKRWPLERFARVAQLLAEKYGAVPIVTWGPAEEERAAELIELSGGKAVKAPELSITRLAALLRRFDVLIAADTGPLHLAAALGTPTAAIFGPKDPAVYGPWGEGHRIVRKDVDCSPCRVRRCDRVKCLMAIEPEEVFGAACDILDGAKDETQKD